MLLLFYMISGVRADFLCHHWTAEQSAIIDNWIQNSVYSPDKEKALCEDYGPGYVFTQGNEAQAPGCGGCWCCKGVEDRIGSADFLCHQWTAEQSGIIQSWIQNSVYSPDKEKALCEDYGPGYVFTQGNEAQAPGCGSCWCCKGVEDRIRSAESLAVCPNGWTAYEPSNKCFKFFATKTSWLKAQTDCRNNGGDLASIEDEATNNFITGTILGNVPDSYHQVFIGGWQFKEKGYSADHWAWVDGIRSFGYTNWADVQEDSGGHENCMSMLMKNDAWNVRGKWNDVSCNLENWFPYICSRWNTDDVTEYIGSCGYISGKEIDSTYTVDLNVTCCNKETRTCGNGVSCETICGSFAPEYFATFISTKPEDDEKCVEIRNPCSKGVRNKRSTAINIRQLGYCPHKVKRARAIRNFSECCLHPYVYRFVHECKNIFR